MHLTQAERSIHIAHEEAREAAETGATEKAAVECIYCEAELEESDVHLVRGEAFCASCALDEASRLRMDPNWKGLEPAVQIEVLEAFQSAAAEVESSVRAELRRKAGAL